MLALSGRPPRPRPARHSAIAAAALIAVGVGCLALSNRDRPPLIVAGIVATILGCLLLGPLAIRIFSGVAGRVPIAPRLALRDLVRYQARSGAALAAVTLALGIAATVVVVASAEEAKAAAEPPNLSDRQIRVYLGPTEAREFTPVDAPAAARPPGRERPAARRPARRGDGDPAPQGLATRRDSDASSATPELLPPVELTRRLDDSEGRKLYRAASRSSTSPRPRCSGTSESTPPRSIRARTSSPTAASGPTSSSSRASTERARSSPSRTSRGSTSASTSSAPTARLGAARSFITLDGLRRHGWKQIPAGWLVESSRPLTSDQIADARDVAADAGLTIEVRAREQPSHATVMAIATAAGALLALAILAMTVGLIRSESAGDLRTLTATGATSRIRRTLTATTAGALALLGALLGVAGAYVVLAATYHDDLGYLSDVPVLYLALAVVGVPLAATAAGWLLAGREPPAIARPAIE